MKILLIKMSSMGDVIHTLPALTDAQKAISDIQFDWVVEPAFSEIPTWHASVNKIIPINLRQWRKHPFDAIKNKSILNFYRNLNQTKYDLIIDAQGLLKSAVVAKCAKGVRCGYDKNSIKEKMASYFYDQQYAVSKNQHAILRIRELLSQILNYTFDKNKIEYQINLNSKKLSFELPEKYVVFLHGTTWETKCYAEKNWGNLLQQLNPLPVLLPWGNLSEKARADNLASQFQNALVLPKLNIEDMAVVLKNAKAVVAVDTGLGHLSAALSTPTISLYGPTDPKKVGAMGDNQIHLCAESNAPLVNINPDKISEILCDLIKKSL